MNGKINNSNKEKKYNEKFKNIEENLENKAKDNNTIKLYIIYLNQLKKILFTLFFYLKYIQIIIQKK